jgi:hypothetical protein
MVLNRDGGGNCDGNHGKVDFQNLMLDSYFFYKSRLLGLGEGVYCSVLIYLFDDFC